MMNRMLHADHQQTDLERIQCRVRERFPTARLKAIYDKDGTFKFWRIVHGGVNSPLKFISGCYRDDEHAWEDAASQV